jgi:predicted pyridoxine 5'-phosphate oxidase superfamily flavin-nucleotide-binding protein
MGHKFAEIAFTESVKKIQEEQGSRQNYASWDQGPDYHDTIGNKEADFIAKSDSFYMSSVSETAWPYVQHRGGPLGFMRVIDENTIGFADYRGNRQYVSAGNFTRNDRVALLFMDYPNRRRLKVLGRISLVGKDEPEVLAKLKIEGYRARVERGFLITVKAFDWNCPQHITPRFTQAQVEELMAPIIKENEQLKSKLGE